MKRRLLLGVSAIGLCGMFAVAQQKDDKARKHASALANAPESARARANPYQGKPEAPLAGRKLFERHCAECHGVDARGRGKAPALVSEGVAQAPPGALFWFLTNGNLRAGMPSWSRLPDAQRWQLVTFLKTLR
jgi:mono/diheme cytochrome c family protein